MAFQYSPQLVLAQPDQVAAQNIPKLATQTVHDIGHLNRPAKGRDHRGHSQSCDPARDDQVKERKIGLDIQGKSVPSNPAAEVNAQRCYFLRAGPNSGQTLTPRALDPETGENSNENLLQSSHIEVDVSLAAFETQDWVAHKLSGAMKRDISASVHFVALHSSGCECLTARQEVTPCAVAPQRDRGGMLEQKEHVLFEASFLQPAYLHLQLQRPRIVRSSEEHCVAGFAGESHGASYKWIAAP